MMMRCAAVLRCAMQRAARIADSPLGGRLQAATAAAVKSMLNRVIIIRVDLFFILSTCSRLLCVYLSAVEPVLCCQQVEEEEDNSLSLARSLLARGIIITGQKREREAHN